MSNHSHHHSLVVALPSCALLVACSGDVVNLGETASELSTANASCPVDAGGAVRAQNQQQLDALAGCEVIEGDLYVYPFEGADFRPLGSLRVVEGQLELGRLSLLDSEFLSQPVASFEAELALREAGWMASLEGFEALESVGGLHLLGLAASSLEPLANLRTLTQGGVFELGPCTALRSLAGLERLTGLTDVLIQCNTLESLAALAWPRSLNSLTLQGASIADLGDFDVDMLGSLSLVDTPLTNLDAFSSLRAILGLSITNNDALTNADGVANLGTLNRLGLVDNDRLERMPDFDSTLSFLEELEVVSNRSLVALPSFPGIKNLLTREGLGLPTPPERLDVGVDAFVVRDNPALKQVVMPLALPSIRFLQIEANAALEQLSFTDVTAVDFVSISDNPALGSVELGALQTVDELHVVNNPQLPLEEFESVRTFESQLSSEPAPATSNP